MNRPYDWDAEGPYPAVLTAWDRFILARTREALESLRRDINRELFGITYPEPVAP